MIQLPNDFTCSNPSIFPKNWQSGGNAILKQEWRIQSYFHDPSFKEKYKYGKLVYVRGMNVFKTLAERRAATKNLLDNELRMLLDEGYNPITKARIAPINIDYEIDPSTPIIPALEKVCEKLKIPDYTRKSVVSALKYISKSIKLSKLTDLQIKNISRRHVVAILDNCEQVAVKWSATNYNHYRAYLMMLFKKLVQLEAIETNPVLNIDKQSVIVKYKRVLTEDERKKKK